LGRGTRGNTDNGKKENELESPSPHFANVPKLMTALFPRFLPAFHQDDDEDDDYDSDQSWEGENVESSILRSLFEQQHQSNILHQMLQEERKVSQLFVMMFIS
jgi:hypothetical protein